MSDQDYTTTFLVDRTPAQVFKAINDTRSWWLGDIQGSTDELGGEFTYRFGDPNMHTSKQKITEFVPGKKVVWHVEEAALSHVEDTQEWNGTDIVFDISERDGKTEVRFTHVGLTPEVECYNSCSNAWSSFVNGKLQAFINANQD